MAFSLIGDDTAQFIAPTPIPDPYWVAVSPRAAELIQLPLGADRLPIDPDWLAVLAGNRLEVGDIAFPNPMATVYSGHQFGHWAGQLGDGRAILLGDLHGQELQLKGAGITRYSRMGDGRAVLRSSIREFLCSEAMHALGIPTTRALSVVGSKQGVRRETMETAAVCARLAPSFIRIGHFEHFAALGSTQRLRELANDLIQNHYPECQHKNGPFLELFKAISERSAKLVAHWQAVGFCHGVLNSDNISALGLTMDYGPFGFLDHTALNHICNHTDTGGRYAYHRQPQIMHWNMACLANAMIPLIEKESPSEDAADLLRGALSAFPPSYEAHWLTLFRKKLGLEAEASGDMNLIEHLLQLMHANRADFTTTFRLLAAIEKNASALDSGWRDQFADREGADEWLNMYRIRLEQENTTDDQRKIQMNRVNPKYILRNHLAQQAIVLAQADDFSGVNTLLDILSNPFDEQPAYDAYAQAPLPNEVVTDLSCSS
ncbi:MAG: YdiU family protein [Polynucleobacter sp.]|nr:YdiU family protein [Polynucleobacter sp.]